MKKLRIAALALALFCATLVGGCGGGSSSCPDTDSNNTDSNNWDQMIWDQGIWQ